MLRAVYEWCVDNGYTPYISVLVDSNTRVPKEHVRNGEIVLNIGPLAASRLQMGNEIIECTARFSGVAQDLSVPVAAVTSIYARENGRGMSFEAERKPVAADVGDAAAPLPTLPTSSPKRGGKPTLRRVK